MIMDMVSHYLGRWRNRNTSKVSSSMIRSTAGNLFPEAQTRMDEGHISETSNLRVFSYKELKTATVNFQLDDLLSGDGFGKVFKGWVDEETLAPVKFGPGMMVAVKKWNPESLEEWQTEVDFLGKLSHPNIVKLLGHCSENKELLLVYEHMPKGTLHDRLFQWNPESEVVLSWDNRLTIATAAARAVTFLHSLQNQIIHRDIKPSNIFLDEVCYS